MKRLLIALTGLAVLAVPVAAIAGVAGSDHDMTSGGDKLCYACHVPHNASGDVLWSSTPGSTYGDMRDLCATCHDGVTATAGVGTVFTTDPTIEQHKAIGSDCNGCHDPHNQGADNTGKFIVDGLVRTNGSYCETCHDATMFTGAETLGDHTAGITHFTDGTFTCNGCHTAHGAVQQSVQIGSLTNPILLADNNNSTYYGAFCVSCHAGTAPTGGTGDSGGIAATDNGNWYAESVVDGSETRHPTTTNSTAWGGTGVGGCNLCHEVHDPTGTAYKYLLKADNTDSAYCISCHDGSSGPGIGTSVQSHPIGAVTDATMNNLLSPALPWADEIDEDGTTGADWSSATADAIVCESCHSVHRQGIAANGGFLLRDENTNNQICQACHSDN